MGAPLGNQNAAKGKRWAAAIERALERKATGKPRPTDVSDFIAGVDLAADEFVSQMFAEKDLGYFKEFGDRLDGRTVQATEISGPDGSEIPMKTIVNFVAPGDGNRS